MKSRTAQTNNKTIKLTCSEVYNFGASIFFNRLFLFALVNIFTLIFIYRSSVFAVEQQTLIANVDSEKFKCPFYFNSSTTSINTIYAYGAFQLAAKKVYQAYFNHQLTKENFDQCLIASRDEQWFLQAINAEFFRRSIEQLRSSKAPATQKLMKHYDSIYQAKGESADQHALFRLTGHLKELSPTDLQAGFHRGNHSIFMDIFRIPPSDWLFIFTHELIHSLDDIAFEALPIYQDDLIKRRLELWAKNGGRIENAPREIENRLWSWLQAGLDLSLLSEYRAWVVTAWIYIDEVKLCNWKRLQWFEAVFTKSLAKEKNSNKEKSIKSLTFSYLDNHSPDRTDDLFEQPVIGFALNRLRTEIRDDIPELGELEQINPNDDFQILEDLKNYSVCPNSP